MRIQFIGAARQVTGSRYLLQAAGLRLLVDCGMFQERDYLGRNWEPSPAAPDSIDHVLLTHAHLDHCGLLPRLVAGGYARPILTTAATKDLAEIVLKDSAHIQEEDAEFKKQRHQREGRTGPYPVKPLYTQADVEAVRPLLQPVEYNRPLPLGDHVTVTFHDGGHILGSAMLEFIIRENGTTRTVVFSGDIGEWNKPIIRDPSVFERADYVVMESTYGMRNHPEAGPPEDQLEEVINATVNRGGNIVIPTFAIERAQELMYYLWELLRENRIPHLLVFLDSPMAVDVTEVFLRHRECMDEETIALLQSGANVTRFPGLKMVTAVEESKAINRITGSCIIMAGAGMCNAGRIKHHLANNISGSKSTILFVGYQAAGTLGRLILDGRKSVRIHGQSRRVKARVAQVHGLSAHADQESLLRWVGSLRTAPRCVFLTHGDEESATTLGKMIHDKWGWPARIPAYRHEVELD